MKLHSNDAATVKKQAMTRLQQVHDMAAKERRLAAARDDLKSIRKNRSEEQEPIEENRGSSESRASALVANGLMVDGPGRSNGPTTWAGWICWAEG